MNINEIVSGKLTNPNIPDFTNHTKECTVDGYDIVSTTFKNCYAFGILDDKNTPMSYCLLKPAIKGLSEFVEIHTLPAYKGKNLAAILIMALKGKLGIKFLINKDDVVSQDGRNLLLKMSRIGKLSPRLLDGTLLAIDELEKIFNTLTDTPHALVFEGSKLKDEIREDGLNTWWYLRDPDTGGPMPGMLIED